MKRFYRMGRVLTSFQMDFQSMIFLSYSFYWREEIKALYRLRIRHFWLSGLLSSQAEFMVINKTYKMINKRIFFKKLVVPVILLTLFKKNFQLARIFFFHRHQIAVITVLLYCLRIFKVRRLNECFTNDSRLNCYKTFRSNVFTWFQAVWVIPLNRFQKSAKLPHLQNLFECLHFMNALNESFSQVLSFFNQRLSDMKSFSVLTFLNFSSNTFSSTSIMIFLIQIFEPSKIWAFVTQIALHKRVNRIDIKFFYVSPVTASWLPLNKN